MVISGFNMNLQLLFISSGLLVLVQADPKCDKEIVESFPQKCNELNADNKHSCFKCEDCSKNVRNMYQNFDLRISLKEAKLADISRKIEDTLAFLIYKLNNKIKAGPKRCHNFTITLTNPSIEYLKHILEKCTDVTLLTAPEDSRNFIVSLPEFLTDHNLEDDSKCVCSYVVPYFNTVCENYQRVIDGYVNCDVKKEFENNCVRKWKECININIY